MMLVAVEPTQCRDIAVSMNLPGGRPLQGEVYNIVSSRLQWTWSSIWKRKAKDSKSVCAGCLELFRRSVAIKGSRSRRLLTLVTASSGLAVFEFRWWGLIGFKYMQPTTKLRTVQYDANEAQIYIVNNTPSRFHNSLLLILFSSYLEKLEVRSWVFKGTIWWSHSSWPHNVQDSQRFRRCLKRTYTSDIRSRAYPTKQL